MYYINMIWLCMKNGVRKNIVNMYMFIYYTYRINYMDEYSLSKFSDTFSENWETKKGKYKYKFYNP